MSQGELYACVYVKEFPAQAAMRLAPELHGRACVVMDGEPPFEQVCSLNAKARLAGLRRGMTRVEVETFREAHVQPRSSGAEMAAKAVAIECVERFSPRMQDRSDDIALLLCLDIAGTERLFGSSEMLAGMIVEAMKAHDMSARVAVSSNLNAAVYVAKSLTGRTNAEVIHEGKEAAALAPLPLGIVDMPESHAETFALWGVDTLGALAALPEKELAARMGQEGVRLRQLACGELPYLFEPATPKLVLEDKTELDSPVLSLESLLFVFSAIFERLILRARAHALALAGVTVTLWLDTGATYRRTVRPALPSVDRAFWLKLLHLDLDAHPPGAAVVAVGVSAEPGSTSAVQRGLFSPSLPEPAHLDVTMARVRAVVGGENAGSAVLEDTHRLDGFHMEAFGVPSRKPSLSHAEAPHVALRRLRPALRTHVVLNDSRPATFSFREQRYTVEYAYGPWLTSGEWWSETLWGAEQWDLIARSHYGVHLYCCLVRDLMNNQWHIEGLYD